VEQWLLLLLLVFTFTMFMHFTTTVPLNNSCHWWTRICSLD